MKPIDIAGKLLLTTSIFLCLVNCKSKPQNEKQQAKKDTVDQAKKPGPLNKGYNNLRDRAFTATPEKIGVQLPENQVKVYGVIMDLNMDGSIATLVSLVTGDASLYLSTGGGFLGGSTSEKVRQASASFVNTAEQYLNKATATDATPLPVDNSVKFYFLTNKGKFVGQEQLQNFETSTSIWSPLFEEANNLMLEMRMSSGDVPESLQQ